MLSETSLTTQTSSLLRGLTETGSTPTGISAINRGLEAWVTSKTDSRASGVLTAKSRVPSGDRRTGLVCLPSKFTYEPRARADGRMAALAPRNAMSRQPLRQGRRRLPESLRFVLRLTTLYGIAYTLRAGRAFVQTNMNVEPDPGAS